MWRQPHVLQNGRFVPVWHSMVASPRGEVVEELTQEAGGMIVQTIDLDEVAERRATMPSLKTATRRLRRVLRAVKAEY
ncbi:MAG: nitrilase-related carbon-nitrogen hydrolase [Ruthenibacterium sp.]